MTLPNCRVGVGCWEAEPHSERKEGVSPVAPGSRMLVSATQKVGTPPSHSFVTFDDFILQSSLILASIPTVDCNLLEPRKAGIYAPMVSSAQALQHV